MYLWLFKSWIKLLFPPPVLLRANWILSVLKMLLYLPTYTKWVTRAVMNVVLVHFVRAYVEPMIKLHAILTLSGCGGKEHNCTTGTHWTWSCLDHTTSPNTLKKRKASSTYWESTWFLSSSTQPSQYSACSQKYEKQPFLLSSVCPHGTMQLPLHRFSYLVFEGF